MTVSLSIAEDKVDLNVDYSKNLIRDFKVCKATIVTYDEKISILTEISRVKTEKVGNLSMQYEKCDTNFSIVEKQASEWEASYTQCVEDTVDCGTLPWYKFDLKSVLTGVAGVLLIVGL